MCHSFPFVNSRNWPVYILRAADGFLCNYLTETIYQLVSTVIQRLPNAYKPETTINQPPY